MYSSYGGTEGIHTNIGSEPGFIGSNSYGVVLIGNTSGFTPIMFGVNSSPTSTISYIN